MIGLVLAVGLFLGSIAIVGYLLVRIPATYFLDSHPRHFWIDRHPVIRYLGLAAKNLFGVVLVGIGIIMALPGVPGQGILTILFGVMLLDFPGKRRLEKWLVRLPWVRSSIDSYRVHRGQPPLLLEEPTDPRDPPAKTENVSERDPTLS
jgi:uncharacterized membrane protein YbaN (DUF454 family)